jgi:transposase
METWIGIDVSMETLDFGWTLNGAKHHFQVPNTMEGFEQALSKTPSDAKFVMEATGTYYLNLALHLDEKGQYLSVINPICTKSHMRSELRRSKSDKTDSFALARFGQEKAPARWNAPAPDLLQMRQLLLVCDTLKLEMAQLGNKLHAMDQCRYASSYAMGILEELKDRMESQCKEAMEYLDELASRSMSRTVEIIESICGIGRETALRMAVSIGDFHRFSNSRKLVSYCGVSPTVAQSGTSVHSKGTISRMGGSRIRTMLYMCAWSAVRYNPQCKAMWERMKEKGKPGKLILMAVVNKLIRLMYSMIIHDTMYNPNFLAQAA